MDEKEFSYHRAKDACSYIRTNSNGEQDLMPAVLDFLLRNGTKKLDLITPYPGRTYAPAKKAKRTSKKKDKDISARMLKDEIKNLGLEFIEKTIGALDSTDHDLSINKDRLMSEFEIGVSVLIDDLVANLYRHKRSAKGRTFTKVTKRQFEEACAVLEIPNIAFGDKLDQIKLRKQANRRIHETHPDKYGTEPSQQCVDEFKSVMHAKAVLEYYSSQLGS
jgi:hypothetical protein